MEKQENRISVMGDIHGAYRALIQCLEGSMFNYENDTLIQLVDVVDRNNDVFECVEELLKIKNLIAIRGNHDAWFHQFLETDYHPLSLNYGGLTTLESYLKHCQPNSKIIKSANGYKTSLNAQHIPESHKAFFKRQTLYHVDDENRCFVHAGFDLLNPFYVQNEENYYFDRSLWMDALKLKNQEYVSGQLTNFNQMLLDIRPQKGGTQFPQCKHLKLQI
ncbi:metallophosphoesterase [Sphingobacterium sp. BN32]|uniref:metallophosphoesterase n=1 Tax=Sphingobacterium sp. BN32 TaxID=3058432 RepID=UPI00265CC785|nr:metallophosphoesterase [Sphingobacterium sp. BN32]WKK59905.1 metallophosphoesterase [Sphingobacterium sp. BN32]